MPCHQSVMHLLLHDGVGLAMSCFRVSTIMCCNHYPLAQLASEAGHLMSVWPSTRCYTSGRADQPLYSQFISQQLVELLPCNCRSDCIIGPHVLPPLIQEDVSMLRVAVVLLRRPEGLLHVGLIHHIHQLVIQQQPVLAALDEADIMTCINMQTFPSTQLEVRQHTHGQNACCTKRGSTQPWRTQQSKLLSTLCDHLIMQGESINVTAWSLSCGKGPRRAVFGLYGREGPP